ncbi:MAG: EamA family transporter [Candidatus Aenigmatarchaeota archaeon]
MEIGWIVFALLSALMAALVAIFGKIGLEGIDANTATMIRAGIMFSFLVGVILLTGKSSQISGILSNQRALMYIVLSGVAGALSWLFYFVALQMGKASQVVPIDRLSIIFVIILSVLILGEQLSMKVAIGTALMAVGAILIALG